MKNITVTHGDKLGVYKLHKKRGKFTLNEIAEALQNHDPDFFYIVIDTTKEDDGFQCYGVPDDKGDFIEAYKLFALKTAVFGEEKL